MQFNQLITSTNIDFFYQFSLSIVKSNLANTSYLILAYAYTLSPCSNGPTPSGVPVKIRSPSFNVKYLEQY